MKGGLFLFLDLHDGRQMAVSCDRQSSTNTDHLQGQTMDSIR